MVDIDMLDSFKDSKNGLISFSALVGYPIIYMTLGLSVALFGSIFVMRYLPSMPMYNALSVSEELAAGTGEENHNADLIGQQGVAVTALRPSGRVKIGDSEYEVVSQHEFVEAGTSVKVVSADGMRILVDLVG